MSYEPTVWQAGDTVTSAKLNKIEQGLATNILFVWAIANDDSPNTYHLDKTWQEIHDAPFAVIKQINENPDAILTYVVSGAGVVQDENYIITVIGYTFTATADGPNEYPTFTQSMGGNTQ